MSHHLHLLQLCLEPLDLLLPLWICPLLEESDHVQFGQVLVAMGLQFPLPPIVAGHPQLMACTLGRCPGIAQPAAPEGGSYQVAGRDE